MNHDVAIEVRNLGKQYRLGEDFDLMNSFRESLSSLPRKLLRGLKQRAQALAAVATEKKNGDDMAGGAVDENDGTVWALKDVSFQLKRGESLGIIGRNGSGKSTLLKILSRITLPTEGEADIHGRVAALLEVGTGFNVELTGRDNIYLNGAILGMRKREIDSKFDAIVDFAGVAPFIDTPVKRYSSGMKVRLGFAVAAHLEPEILIVDEVLSVGDAEFRQKCLNKMQSVAGEGRTILFVSHNMQAIKNLCQHGILLNKGRLVFIGAAEEAVNTYLSSMPRQKAGVQIEPGMHTEYPPGLEIWRLEILDQNGQVTDQLMMDERFSLQFAGKFHNADEAYRLGFILWSADGVKIASSVNTSQDSVHMKGRKGENFVQTATVKNILQPGAYLIDIIVKSRSNVLVDTVRGIRFNVLPVSVTKAKREGAGLVSLHAEWSEPQAM